VENDPAVGSRIRCSTRCLEADTVAKGRAELEDRPVVRISYTCKISGQRETLVLVSASHAEALAEELEGIDTSLEVHLVAALLETALCECDLATLAPVPESEVLSCIRTLGEKGLSEQRTVHGMNYHGIVPGPPTQALRARVGRDLRDEPGDPAGRSG